MFAFSLFLSVSLLLVVAGIVLRSTKPVGNVIGVCLPAAILPSCLAMLLLPFQATAAVMAVTAVLLFIPRYGQRTYLGVAVAVTVVAYALSWQAAVEQRREQAELRVRYGFESLADRLPARSNCSTGVGPADPKHLERIEVAVDRGNDWRSVTLRRLHDERVRDFATTPGFGFMRMAPPPSARVLEIDLVGPVPKPTYGGSDRSAGAAVPVWSAADLDGLHHSGVIDFANPAGFGLVRDGKVAGFDSHRFSKVPGPDARWAVADLDLIGLVVHPEPVAYVSRNLPRMDELRTAPTRPLDPFEGEAVEKLRTGEELVVLPADGGLRMVGAVRAAKQCVECHGGGRGDLLGAFSYRLRPTE